MGDPIAGLVRRGGAAVLIVTATLAFAGSATASTDPGHNGAVVQAANQVARPHPAPTLRGRSTFRPTHPTRGATASAVVTT